MPRLRLTRRRLAVFAVILAVTALAAPQAWAWSHLRAARAALGQYHPEEARRHLDDCLRVWAGRPSVHLLASRACRQTDDFEAAGQELHAAQDLLGEATDETAFEWALLQAASGNVREVEGYLHGRAESDPAAAPLVWEAMAQGDLRIYRILDAMSFLRLWLDRDPNNLRALDLRGQTYVTGKGVTRGADDYRTVLERDPSRDQTRWRLVVALLDLGAYQEAADHLQLLTRADPDNPKTTAMLARCYNFLGRRDEARQMLDAALARHPDSGLCLRTRGQLALMDDQKADAERWLRRAVAVQPQDYQSQWLLFEALRQQGKDAEAKAQNAVADRVKQQASRLSDLQSRKLAEFPLDPALHFEMGTLLAQTGRTDVAEKWFLTALGLDPDHRPSHAALAALYDAHGDKEKAAFHRGKAEGTAEPPQP